MEQQTTETSIFENEIHLSNASSGKRLGNYVIDLLSFYAVIFLFFFFLAMVSPDTSDAMLSSLDNELLERVLALVFFGIYMGIVEAIFRGRTLGKLITGTRAVNMDGTAITPLKAFYRGIIRAVPFNPMSGLGTGTCNPWHDRWTDTCVIEIKNSILPIGA
ncbi:RDD family protein [Chitinophaga sp. RAB17]|uniref:RDD family protein n=1 Tax=Chitinophaga sp. RAB17 TaxID=3233049 RepID=UPI003F91E6E6